MTKPNPAPRFLSAPSVVVQRDGIALASGWWIALFVISGPLNPAILLTGFLTEPEMPFMSGNWPLYSVPALKSRAVFVVGPAILLAIIAVATLRRSGPVRVTAAWRRGYWMSVLFSPVCLGLFFALYGFPASSSSLWEQMLIFPMVTVMGFLVGWLSLIIPWLAIIIGLPAMIFGIVATRLCLRPAEHQGPPDVPAA